jgi:hypothetical protein
VPEFKVLAGLPGDGPSPIPFPASGRGRHREGYVVQFPLGSGDSWIGNFQLGTTKFTGCFEHPDQIHVVVVSGGEVYIVNPASRSAQELGGTVKSVLSVGDAEGLLLEEGLWLTYLNESGLKWRTRRLSWDGIRNLLVQDGVATGQAWRYDNTWHDFKVALESGATEGGAYTGP